MDVITKMKDMQEIYLNQVRKMEGEIKHLEQEIEKYYACVDMLDKIIESAKELEEENNESK